MIHTVKVSSKGQITIPQEIRKKVCLATGDKLFVILNNSRIYLKKADKKYLLKKLKKSLSLNPTQGLPKSQLKKLLNKKGIKKNADTKLKTPNSKLYGAPNRKTPKQKHTIKWQT